MINLKYYLYYLIVYLNYLLKANIINMGICGENRNKDFNPIFEGIDPLNFYDIIIDIQSIKQIGNGWDILTNARGVNEFNANNEKDIKIGVIGNGNKGKSFILSKISGITLPNGFSIKTKGLSIKFPDIKEHKNRKIILLDSAGQETPVINNEKNTTRNENQDSQQNEIKKEVELTEKSRDKLLTEFFLENFIIKYSDLLILVVGILTFSEQKLINKIKKTYLKLKKTNELVIIHNLQSYVTMKQVKDYINEILKKSDTFNLIEQFIVSPNKGEEKWHYFCEPKSNPKTIHLIFAREESEAGNFYNNKTIKHLYNIMNNIKEKEPLNLYKNIKDFFINISSEILENKIEQKDIILEKNKIKLIKDELILRKCSINELGLNIFSLSGYEPNYTYYIDQSYLHILCEIPGTIDTKTFSSHANFEGGKCVIKITGQKIDDINDIQKNCNKYFTNREFGKFNLNIEIEDVNIDISKGKIINKNNGLYEIIYPIKEKSVIISL